MFFIPGSGWGCPACAEYPQADNQTYQSAGNPYKPWLTKADESVLVNRISCPEDHNVMIDRRTGRESPLVQKHR